MLSDDLCMFMQELHVADKRDSSTKEEVDLQKGPILSDAVIHLDNLGSS